ncbi:hypothetical protein [Geomicrobium sp. JCM 19039]|uniref:hypothetical protein n=1 Tax=Geomicrobium sp. JCM 19039 TaxID=1460636 RepID=UPI00045F4BD6|nr:hypothetical protein [Geomicrobium sp. JCM 19039]GAK12474.1 hypothetical protein JCM19039_2251 [Geomicrobium sp. JCM 19039]
MTQREGTYVETLPDDAGSIEEINTTNNWGNSLYELNERNALNPMTEISLYGQTPTDRLLQFISRRQLRYDRRSSLQGLRVTRKTFAEGKKT